MTTFIVSILVFSVIILVHEFGHYKAARSVGIKVEEFAIGMGPLIFKKVKNGTVYSLRAIPIGGFVRMEGEEEDVKSPTSYSAKTILQRFKVIFAGPFMNFVLALVLFIVIAFAYGINGTIIDIIDENSYEYQAGIRTGDKIISVNGSKAYIWEDVYYEIVSPNSTYYTAEIERDGQIKQYKIENNYRKLLGITSTIVDGKTTTIVSPSDMTSPAYKAGIKEGDKIIKINDIEVNTWEEIIKQIDLVESNKEVKVTVDRNGKTLDFNIAPVEQISVRFNTHIEKSFIAALASSAYKTVYYIKLMFITIAQLITGQLSSDTLGGPVMVISMVGEASKNGLLSVLNFAAFISINLGFMNLLPIPALDGSKLVFLIVEKIRGKAIPAEKEGVVHFIGFVILISFMLFITYKDILRLFRL